LHFDVGDSVTLSGVTTVATDGTPKAARDVYNDIKDSTVVKVNDTITVGDGEYAIKYTVVEDADEDLDTYKVSRDTLLSMINDGDSVTYDDGKGSGVKKYTVIGDIASSSKATDVVSAKTAYSLMADELQKASSIGTDAGKEASVTSNGDGKFTIKQGSAEVKDALVFNLHVGADADMTNKIIVNLKSMSAAGLGIQGLNVKDTTGTAATYAIDAIEDAIKTVSAQRSLLGAVQNRLDHTINNLDNVVENTTSAESAIRDTDMATEMVKYSNANILSQAGQSMLAQANQSNQGVLSLLG
jgi:flagellin-like hook-associated protein FlgL